MRVLELHIENVKRVKAVTIAPGDDSLVVISGDNDQGKSSVIDSIMYALAGTKNIPDEPIRKGQRDASVTVDLGEYVVTRTWTKKKSYLRIESKEGSELKSPQKLLDGIVGSLMFDPGAFKRMKPKEQVTWLQRLTGLDFTLLDAEKTRHYEDRTLLGRQIKALEGELAATSYVRADVQLPDEEVSVATLTEEHRSALNAISDNQKQRDLVERLRVEAQEKKLEIARIQESLNAAEKAYGELVNTGKEQAGLASALFDPDVAAIETQLASAENTNKLVRDKARFSELQDRIQSLQIEHDGKTDRIETIEEDKRQQIVSAKMPVQGLSFDETGVRIDGVPFDQAGSSKQWRISVAMGLADKPKLRIGFVHDGSLLDDEAMLELEKIAEEYDAQIWVERVGTTGKVGIIIEDGMVAGSELAAVVNEVEQEGEQT